MLGYIWQYFYASFFRYWLKWFIRQVTGKCELQRICSGYKPGATRTTKAEYSLQSSKNKVLRNALQASSDDLEQCVDQIMQEKNVKAQKDPRFKESLQLCLFQITGYKSLYASVEDLRKEVFDSEKLEHETMLLKLWDLLMPTVKLESRVTKQWGDIGFQGDDPKTDFRGMGLLGLINLVFFSENYTDAARQVLFHANHPKLGYSYAIVGINLTEMAYSLLKSGALKPHFYNTILGKPELQHFHQLYCYLAYEFDKFWVAEEPESIMQFNHYREKFHSQVKAQLQDPNVSLTLTVHPKN
ncbi:ELMO domain-containing protein 2 isoform X2 [Myripristis murdjan]|uniref:ELMO/CED-12 domain containing 2 n=2 Tax=Myripristis murdjan TaxID=586833 RepID=A0A667YN95_9TELE|nr:ELMO domain-containing protein 2 isoform X2 [Myripristis murdjan]XP_029915303.1 ELMO domain-containing protein 2 isoform X2 [Myripristis murdjan]XP_029915310.1 ELMO domain-containing protein 2 isoform X2 [Myripristis murdjan]XP_029915319.1 ELMO domain-containing protein 2 isoform X2 [Myripristis murdjan]XP_029915326.1 ELMO domain-containing protein 2 isoform X2 [Myripristis murdjan]